ncbi:MAG: hypothetical protein ABW217_06990, partial [Polyangiaceae bacterium]
RLSGSPPTSVVRNRAVLNAADEKNVLIVSGGSYAADGVDAKILERELRALGYSVKVSKLAITASNHFERFRMYEDLARGVSGPRPGQRWVYLAEVHLHYDRGPLAQLVRNQDTVRTYYYLTPHNALTAWRALSTSDIDPVDVRAYRWLLVRHTLIQTFNVGLDARLMPEDGVSVRRRSGHKPPRKRKRKPPFQFDPEALLQEARSPQPSVPVPTWLFDLREPREKELWSRYDASWVYFGVPSTSPEQLRYIRSFCEATEEICITPDLSLLKKLRSASSWKNVGHMNAKGAKRYSAWLARELDRAGVLQK